jgi:hypothetical protein
MIDRLLRVCRAALADRLSVHMRWAEASSHMGGKVSTMKTTKN